MKKAFLSSWTPHLRSKVSDVASRCHPRCVSSMVRATRFCQPIRLQNINLHHDDQWIPGEFRCSILDSIGIDLPVKRCDQHVGQSLVHASVVYRVASMIAMLHSPELGSHWGSRVNRTLVRHHGPASRAEMVTVVNVRLSIRRAAFPGDFHLHSSINIFNSRTRNIFNHINHPVHTYPKTTKHHAVLQDRPPSPSRPFFSHRHARQRGTTAQPTVRHRERSRRGWERVGEARLWLPHRLLLQQSRTLADGMFFPWPPC